VDSSNFRNVEKSFEAKHSWKSLMGLGFVILCFVLFARYVDIEQARIQIENAGWYAPFLLILVKASTIIIAPLGGGPLYPIAGALFGFWKGSALLIIGDAIGGAVSFFLSRRFGRAFVERMLGETDGMLPRALELMSTVRGFFVTRLCFLTFPEIACWGAGLTKLSFTPFILIHTVVGAVPTLITAGLGAYVVDSKMQALLPFVFILGGLVTTISAFIFLRILDSAAPLRRLEESPAAEDSLLRGQ
jgi:uncharacterized membrane protein YdjX (TVP38/TMEM64 family)